MYYYLTGTLIQKTPTYAVVDNHGIGYEVRISLSTYSALEEGASCKLYTHFYVKEDVQMLYGFQRESEKSAFLQLLSVSGVGPSTALMVLSSLSVEELAQAVATENVALIQSVKGIGAKTAKRLILELKDKFGSALSASAAAATDPTTQLKAGIAQRREEALQALVVLGVNRQAAEKSLQQIAQQHGDTLSIEELIKLTLKSQ